MKFSWVCFFLLVQVAVLFGGGKKKLPNMAITYGFSGGRLGDNLLVYMHAKWLSYKYGIPLAYRPFQFSEKLAFSNKEMALENFAKNHVKIRLKNERQLGLKYKKKIVFEVPYFPESPYELKTKSWPYFKVDWDDVRFVSFLRASISSRAQLPSMILPKEKISVAMHVRRGGSYEQFNEIFPAKFPHDEYYIEALDHLYATLGEQSLYVFVFTDDQHPELVAQIFRSVFKNKNITFDYRTEKNDHDINVLEDFFSLLQFDCLIRTDSNFSLCAAKLKTFLVEIAPEDCELSGGVSSVSSLSITIDSRWSDLFSDLPSEAKRRGKRMCWVVSAGR